MKKVGHYIMLAVAIISGAIVGKIIYDVVSDKKKREAGDREFLDDIEDDFAGLNAVMPQSNKSSEKEQEKKEEVKATTAEPAKAAAVTEKKAETTAAPKTTTSAQPKASISAKPKAVKKVNVSGAKPANKNKSALTCKDVIDATAEVMNVSAEDILSKSRKGDVSNARRIAIYLCANNLGLSNTAICDEFGGIGATSVTNAKKIVTDKIKEDDEFAADIEDIADELKQREKALKG